MEIRSIPQKGYEEVWEARDPDHHFHAFIALHNTERGPALGGVRFYPYSSPEHALADVLRLARSMTYKAAVADLPHGGGKGVIIKPELEYDREIHMEKFGEFIQSLEGLYITAKDVGTDAQDMATFRKKTKWVTGLPLDQGGAGDPSPLTAYGVLVGIKSCLKEITGSENLSGIRVAIQGLGGVGSELARLLTEADCEVWGSDLHGNILASLAHDIGLKPVLPEMVLNLEADVLAPCALGQVLNHDIISQLKVNIVAGGANDQLTNEEKDAKALQEKGILYAPDFVINAGGLIHVAMEITGYEKEMAKEKTEEIAQTLEEIFQISKLEKITTHQAALRVAESRL